MYQKEITVSIDAQNFECDTTGLFIGQSIQVHSDDYSSDSIDVTIDNIAGNVVTLNQALSFTPQVGDKLETKTFTDGDGYLLL